MRRTTPVSRFRPAMATLLGVVGLSCAGPLLAQQRTVADPCPCSRPNTTWIRRGWRWWTGSPGSRWCGRSASFRTGGPPVTERAGRVRVVSPEGHLQDEPWAAPADVFHSGGRGVMGLALHPDVPDEPWVYVMYTLRTDDGPVNRVVRWRDEGTRGVDKEVILDDLPAANIHHGGRIAFGPDGMLYVTVGDTGEAEPPQDLDNLRGSILRVTPAGAVPADNPWPESPVWAYGLRNAQGLAFQPETGSLFVADHGPQARDQIHIVEGGRNYGWPRVLGATGTGDGGSSGTGTTGSSASPPAEVRPGAGEPVDRDVVMRHGLLNLAAMARKTSRGRGPPGKARASSGRRDGVRRRGTTPGPSAASGSPTIPGEARPWD